MTDDKSQLRKLPRTQIARQDAIDAAHTDACRRGLDRYIDPESGFSVWTRLYLEKRGYCCDSGCRHCPYDETK